MPVWGAEAEALAVIQKFKASVAGEKFDFEPVDIRSSLQSGGPNKRTYGHFHGVDVFNLPEQAPRLNPVTGCLYD